VVLSAAAHFPGIPNRIVSFILRDHMRDSLAMEKVVQDSGFDWTIARPPRLTQEQYVTCRSREGAAPRRGFSISRKAVAAFMLDAIQQKKYYQKIVGIAKESLESACLSPTSLLRFWLPPLTCFRPHSISFATSRFSSTWPKLACRSRG